MSEFGQGQGGWPTTSPGSTMQPTPPVPPVGPPPHVPPSASGQAITALVLAIVSWVLCGFVTAIPAIFVAKAELGAIDRGESPISGRSMAQAAFWIAIVNTVCTCLPTIAFVAMMILGLSMSSLGF